MAQLKNLDRIWAAPLGDLATVGNNRQIMRDEQDGDPIFRCYLHGHEIATIKPRGSAGTASVRLDARGHLTATTVAAMKDFLGAFGVRAGVSRAGGKLSASWTLDGERHSRDEGAPGQIGFWADRHPATVTA